MSGFDSLQQPDVAAWRQGFPKPPGLLDTVAHWVGLNQSLVAAQFLWPTFVEVQGCVLLPWEYSEASFERWWTEFSGDSRQIERTINHLHLWDVFSAETSPADSLVHLGKVLATAWSAALVDQHPGRKFTVHFTNEADDYGPTLWIDS